MPLKKGKSQKTISFGSIRKLRSDVESAETSNSDSVVNQRKRQKAKKQTKDNKKEKKKPVKKVTAV